MLETVDVFVQIDGRPNTLRRVKFVIRMSEGEVVEEVTARDPSSGAKVAKIVVFVQDTDREELIRQMMTCDSVVQITHHKPAPAP